MFLSLRRTPKSQGLSEFHFQTHKHHIPHVFWFLAPIISIHCHLTFIFPPNFPRFVEMLIYLICSIHFPPLSNVFSAILTSDSRSKTSSSCPRCPTTGCCPSAAAPCTTAAPAPWRRCVAPGSRRRCFLWRGISRGGQSIWSRWDWVLRQISWRFFKVGLVGSMWVMLGFIGYGYVLFGFQVGFSWGLHTCFFMGYLIGLHGFEWL